MPNPPERGCSQDTRKQPTILLLQGPTKQLIAWTKARSSLLLPKSYPCIWLPVQGFFLLFKTLVAPTLLLLFSLDFSSEDSTKPVLTPLCMEFVVCAIATFGSFFERKSACYTHWCMHFWLILMSWSPLWFGGACAMTKFKYYPQCAALVDPHKPDQKNPSIDCLCSVGYDLVGAVLVSRDLNYGNSTMYQRNWTRAMQHPTGTACMCITTMNNAT